MALNNQKQCNHRQSEAGIATVELALILPIMTLLTFILIELGFGLWNYSTLAYSVHEGARYAAVNSSEPNVISDSKNLIIATGQGLHLTTSDINISWNPDQNIGSLVTVSATYNHQPFTGYSSPIAITSTTSLVVSR